MADPKSGNFNSLKLETANTCTVELPVVGGGSVPLTLTQGDMHSLAEKVIEQPLFQALPQRMKDVVSTAESSPTACQDIQRAVNNVASKNGGGVLKTKVDPDTLRQKLGLPGPSH